MTTNAATRLAVGRVIYSQPGPSVRRSQNRHRTRRLRLIIFIALAAAALYAFAYILPGEAAPVGPTSGAGARCATELTVKRRACVRSRWIGNFAPRACETAAASYQLCLAGQ